MRIGEVVLTSTGVVVFGMVCLFLVGWVSCMVIERFEQRKRK